MPPPPSIHTHLLSLIHTRDCACSFFNRTRTSVVKLWLQVEELCRRVVGALEADWAALQRQAIVQEDSNAPALADPLVRSADLRQQESGLGGGAKAVGHTVKI